MKVTLIYELDETIYETIIAAQLRLVEVDLAFLPAGAAQTFDKAW